MRRALATALAGAGRRLDARSCLSGVSPPCAARSTAWHAPICAVPSSLHFAHASSAASGSEPFAGRPPLDAGGKPFRNTHRASGAGAMRGFVAINKRIIQCVDGTRASAPPANRSGRDVFRHSRHRARSADALFQTDRLALGAPPRSRRASRHRGKRVARDEHRERRHGVASPRETLETKTKTKTRRVESSRRALRRARADPRAAGV